MILNIQRIWVGWWLWQNQAFSWVANNKDAERQVTGLVFFCETVSNILFSDSPFCFARASERFQNIVAFTQSNSSRSIALWRNLMKYIIIRQEQWWSHLCMSMDRCKRWWIYLPSHTSCAKSRTVVEAAMWAAKVNFRLQRLQLDYYEIVFSLHLMTEMQRNNHLLPPVFLHEHLRLSHFIYIGVLQLLYPSSRKLQVLNLSRTLFLGGEIIRSVIISLLSAQHMVPFLPLQFMCDPGLLVDHRQHQWLYWLALRPHHPSLPKTATFSNLQTPSWLLFFISQISVIISYRVNFVVFMSKLLKKRRLARIGKN